jgi:hypothetical protein
MLEGTGLSGAGGVALTVVSGDLGGSHERRGKDGKSVKTIWRLLISEDPERENRRLAIGWGEIGDVRSLGSPGAIEEAIRHRNENDLRHTHRGAANWRHGSFSLYDFCFKMKSGDLVILSIGEGKRRLVMEVVGSYEHVAPSQAPVNYQHQRKARLVDMDPNDLWEQAGGKSLPKEIYYRTLVQCAESIDEATLAGIGVHHGLHFGT